MDLQKLFDKSKAKLDTVHPTLRERGYKLIEKAHAEGIYILITQGLRTIEYQNQLYAQGRTTAGKIVTKVKGGYSYHNYGLAIDFAVYAENGRDIDWSVDRRWRRIGAIGESLGLEWGGSWKSFVDIPHFQVTFGLSISDLRSGKKPPQKQEKPSTPHIAQPKKEKEEVVKIATPQKEMRKLDAKTVEQAKNAIDQLAKAGLISSPDYWKERVEESMPVWAYMIMESRKLK